MEEDRKKEGSQAHKDRDTEEDSRRRQKHGTTRTTSRTELLAHRRKVAAIPETRGKDERQRTCNTVFAEILKIKNSNFLSLFR